MKALGIYIVQIIDFPQKCNLSKLHTTETVNFWPFFSAFNFKHASAAFWSSLQTLPVVHVCPK